MTRKNPGTLVKYNSEIEASARRNHGQTLRRKKQQKEQQSTSATPSRDQSFEKPSIEAPQATQNANPTLESELKTNQTIRDLPLFNSK